MSEFSALPLWTDAYLADTLGLSVDEPIVIPMVPPTLRPIGDIVADIVARIVAGKGVE